MTATSKSKTLKSLFIFSMFMSISFLLSKEISAFALEGFTLAMNVIIPTVFPFMILSDFALTRMDFTQSVFLGKLFEKTFRINRVGLNAFFSGILGGFPIGAKCALKLYDDGKISDNECERLICLSNIPSVAYVFCAVGIGMLENARQGLILYFITLISGIITSIISRGKCDISIFSKNKSEQKFDFVNSVKSSAVSSLNIVFFISFFSVVCGMIKRIAKNQFIHIILLPMIEIGNAVTYISDLYILPLHLRLSLISFSLSFSGLSVIMQGLSFKSGSSKFARKVFLLKFTQGIISFIISLAVFSSF